MSKHGVIMVDKETMDKLFASRPRGCGFSQSPSRQKALIDEFVKRECLDEFDERCVTTLTCEMCSEKLSDWVDAPHIAAMAYDKGWRFQVPIKPETGEKIQSGKLVLCQHCTDGKR